MPRAFGSTADWAMVATLSMHNCDIRNQPAYTLTEGARYLKVAPATLRSWVVGRAYPKGQGLAHFQPLIQRAQKQSSMLSFWNLIESHVLRSLRTEHGVSMHHLRKALNFAEKKLGIERLLLNRELCTDVGRLLLERYGELIELSASGQIAMRNLFNEHLACVEWDESKFPVRLYPFSSSSVITKNRPISIDAKIAFGRPILVSRGVSTGAIAKRIDSDLPETRFRYGS